MSFSMAVIALDLEHVPRFFYGNNIDTCGREVGVATLSSSSAAPGTLLVLLVLLRVGRGSLPSGRWLFPTRCVSRGGVGRLIFSGVLLFLLLFCRPTPLVVLWVHIAGGGGWLEHRFCLCINGFLDGLFPRGQVPASDVHLGPDRRSQAFQEVSDHHLLVWSCSEIKLSEDRL